MWEFRTITPFEDHVYLNHTIISISKMVVQYTATIAIFIGRLPHTTKGMIGWIWLWTAVYGLTEGLAHVLGMMTYHHGWHFGWDLLFNVMMFTVLLIHHKNPLIAWIVSCPIIIFLLMHFDVPYAVLK
ncbi:hypothetical protein [Bacillus sp. KH172YL63]|uniref:hypothetical protein n=1 Tax=Bacillus sp. KH172YL63 TaxID=2709784 RepID=UPI0015660ACD|nr:hypothetical protein [Bacillus sp. KH172YL63]